MTTRIHIPNWIIMTVSIQIQSVPVVGVFLNESADYRVVKSGSQIVEIGCRIKLLACEAETVFYLFLSDTEFSKGIVFIVVQYFTLVVYDIGDTAEFIGCIMIVSSCLLAVRTYQFVASVMIIPPVIIFLIVPLSLY